MCFVDYLLSLSNIIYESVFVLQCEGTILYCRFAALYVSLRYRA